MRDRLIEIMKNTVVGMINGHRLLAKTIWMPRVFEQIADCLLANGVIVPPCKVGDTVYVVTSYICEYEVKEIAYDDMFMKFYCYNESYAFECQRFMFFDERIGKTVFLTREEAEAALRKEDEGK